MDFMFTMHTVQLIPHAYICLVTKSIDKCAITNEHLDVVHTFPSID